MCQCRREVRRLLAEEVRLLPCSPRAWKINQVGVRRGDAQIPTALLTASAFNHLETATVLLARSTAPICMGHGMAARGGG